MSYIPSTAVTLPLAMTDGGFGKSNSNPSTVGGVAYYSASGQVSIINGVTTTGRVLLSGNATLPSFSSATYPSGAGSGGQHIRSDGTNWVASTATWPGTCVTNSMIYANTTNSYAQLSTVNSAFLTTTSGGVPTWSTSIISKGPVVTKTATYTATNTDCFIAVTTNTFTITLPDCATNSGLSLTFMKTDNAAATHTIQRAGSDTIWDGSSVTSITRTAQGTYYTLTSFGGTIWFVTAKG